MHEVPTEWAEEYKEEKANGRPPALPPAPFPAGVWFSGVFSNYTVLQRAPAKSAVYGVTSEPSTKVILTVVDESTKASSTPTVVTDPKTGLETLTISLSLSPLLRMPNLASTGELSGVVYARCCALRSSLLCTLRCL